MGGAVFVVVALTPYGGWHKEAKEWTDRVAHTGDKVPHDAWDERFELPARTWASASHRAFTLQATGVAMANATYVYEREFTVRDDAGSMRWDGSTADVVAGELNVEISEGETSVGMISATAIKRTSTNNHTEWFKTKRRVGQRRQAIK
jgi:hypothetical protein